MLILSGHTVHVLPGENRSWLVFDLKRRTSKFPSQAAAVEHAKRFAEAHPPSQVVLFDTRGRTSTLARYRLPPYESARTDPLENPLFGAALSALLIEGLVERGVPVRQVLRDSVEREYKKQLARDKAARKGKRRRAA